MGRGLVAQECGFCVKVPMTEGEGRQQAVCNMCGFPGCGLFPDVKL